MSKPPSRRALNSGELLTGALLLVLGVAAALEARGFDEASRTFPLITAALLAIAGCGIAGHGLVRAAGSAGSGHAAGSGINVFVAVIILVLWALAFVGGAGFVLPTLLMQAVLLGSCGIRRPGMVAGFSIAITTLAYLLFVVLLDIPLPDSRLPAALQGF